MKLFFNVAILISFFCMIAAAIWLVWDQREVVMNILKTAAIVFGSALLCKEVWIIAKEL